MKIIKNYILILLPLLFSVSAFAQPSLYAEDITVNTGDEFEVDIWTDDFTDITEMDVSLGWDKDKLQFIGVTFVNLDTVSSVDALVEFNSSETINGRLGVRWVCGDQDNGLTIDDDFDNDAFYKHPAFRMRFKAISPISTTDTVHYVDSPYEINIIRTSSNGLNIGLMPRTDHHIIINGPDIPPLTLIVNDDLVESETQVCIPVTALNFDGIIAIDYSINFDPTVLEYAGVQNFYSFSFESETLFGVSNADNGVLIYSWFSGTGLSIPDNVTLYEICFNVIGDAGDTSPVEFTNNPSNINVVSLASEDLPNNNIGLTNNGGVLTVFDAPFNGVYLDMNDQTGALGETVCIDLTVSDFNDIISMQYTLTWDPNVLQYSNVDNLNLVGLNAGSFAGNIDGNLLCSWNNNNGVTVPDGTVIGQVCFIIIGPPGSSTSIDITSDYTPVHVVNTTSGGDNIKLKGQAGHVNVIESVPQAIIIDVSSVDVYAGDVGCLTYTVSDFDNVTSLNFTISWNPDVGAFNEIANISSPFSLSDFDITNVGMGLISVNWSSNTPISLSDGVAIFDLCLTGVGLSGSLTVLGITNDLTPINVTKMGTGSTNVGINNNTNGTFQITDLSDFAVNIKAPDVTGFEGQNICVDIDVANFFNVTSVDFTLEWDPSIINNATVSNFQISTSSASNVVIDNAQGYLTFSWSSPGGTGVTLIGGVELFSVCFDVVGVDGEESPLNFTSSILSISATKEQYGDQNVGLSINNGSIRVTRVPEDINIEAPSDSTLQGHQICVDFTIDDFVEMASFQFTLSWDPNILSYTSFEAYGLTGIGGDEIFNANLAEVFGRLTVFWANPPDEGLTLADGEILFTVCFTAIGDAGSMTDIIIDGSHTALEATNIDFNFVDIVPNVPVITILENLNIVESIVNQVDCTGPNSGSIDIDVSGGIPPLNYIWSNNETTQDLIDLPVGNYSVTIYDSGILPDTTIATYEVVFVDNSPTAIASGDEIVFGCENQIITLGNDNSSQGDNIQYDWTTIDGVIVGEINTLHPMATALGSYTLIVLDTMTNCTDTSIVDLTGEIYPLAEVMDDFTICDDSTSIMAIDMPGAYGEWIGPSGAIVSDPLSLTTNVNGLMEGENVFTWILSTDNCSEYDADTVIVTLSGAPVAGPDYFNLQSGNSPYELDVAANDDLSNTSGYVLTLGSLPTEGSISLNDGVFDYTVDELFVGDDGFTYTICNELCPEKCSESFVFIDIHLKSIIDGAEVPNTITPNGDGVNDILIFNELLVNGIKYPDTEFTVTNRWGDLVYHQKYYDNLWGGVNKSGQPLAEGTYYFVLKLDLNKGIVLSGDITILR